jgi:ketosteroid isomerase-like protein
VDEAVTLMRKLTEVTGGTFVLDPLEVLTTEEHAVARARWHAERDGVRCEGNDLAVYRFANGRIVELWFFADGFDQGAHDLVFSFR